MIVYIECHSASISDEQQRAEKPCALHVVPTRLQAPTWPSYFDIVDYIPHVATCISAAVLQSAACPE